ncbi:MAG: methionine-R-sulfoxide reductase [Pirellula sp.]|jgi:methionine-R-sulfoxide reductase|nr:methionine-R-sulfoxide reductase [Pirellula sp.]
MKTRNGLVLGLIAVCGTTLLFAGQPPKGDAENNKPAAGSGNQEKDEGGTKSETGSTKSPKDKGTAKKVDITSYNQLTREEEYVLLKKGTEPAFRGKYTDLEAEGTYICKRCNARLYNSKDKFHSGCGWPSFDDEIKGAVKQQLETDGTGRIEIVCNNCKGHLGHVFQGERLTSKNTRHCVNSISMVFIPKGKEIPKVIKPKAKADVDDSSNLPGEQIGSDKQPGTPVKPDSKK